MNISYNAHSEIAFNRLNMFQFDILYSKNLKITLHSIENNYLYETRFKKSNLIILPV